MLTRTEVETHNQEENLWLILNNSVYNVTNYLAKHPGGQEVILEHAGKDATEAFEDIGHSKGAIRILATLEIGQLDPSELKEAEKRDNMPNIPLLNIFMLLTAISIGSYWILTELKVL